MKKLSCLAFVILLLSACGGSPEQPTEPGGTPTPTAPDLRGQVANWSVDKATVNAVLYDKTPNPAEVKTAEVATGEVGADGKLEIFLNKSVPSGFLTSLDCPSLTQTNPDARQNSFSALEVTQGGKVVGRVALASKQSVLSRGLQAVGDYYVQQTYVDAATTLTGSCSLGGVVSATFQYDLKLNRGWNDVTFKLTSVASSKQTLSLTTGTPAGAAWFFVAAP